MPQPNRLKLDTDDAFPVTELNLTDGESLTLPSGKWTMFIVYRGYW